MVPADKTPSWLVNTAIAIVLGSFVVAIIFSIIDGDWRAVEIISPELLLTLGFLFGARIVKGGSNDNSS